VARRWHNLQCVRRVSSSHLLVAAINDGAWLCGDENGYVHVLSRLSNSVIVSERPEDVDSPGTCFMLKINGDSCFPDAAG
jgi:hypothetical protein